MNPASMPKDYTCPCGVYVHPSRFNPNAHHCSDCPWSTHDKTDAPFALTREELHDLWAYLPHDVRRSLLLHKVARCSARCGPAKLADMMRAVLPEHHWAQYTHGMEGIRAHHRFDFAPQQRFMRLKEEDE